MWHRNTGNTIELLHSARRPVSKQQRQSRNERCNNNAVSDVIRCSNNQRANESKMPEVPDVDIQRTRPAHQQKGDVDQNTNWNNPQAYG
ncbi:hypothetical protein D9M72_607940 [compost metagenome]